MLGQSAQTVSLKAVPKPERSVEPRVAVVVNGNARSVNERVLRSLSHVVPEGDLFLSHSHWDLRRIVSTILDRGYPTVFCGGGDGTFMWMMNETFRQIDERDERERTPRFGILKLGTGNGLANLVHASSMKGDRMLDDVLRARAGEVPGYRRLDLLRVDGQRTVFAGMGVDGQIINDYNSVKTRFGKGALKRVMTGTGGYVASVALRTIPHYLFNSAAVECEVINGARSAFALDADGTVKQEIAPGECLYRGKLNLAAAATMPFYGFGMKAFPHAGTRRGMMHLRLAAVTCTEVLAHLSPLWKGRWFPSSILEFHASDVTIRFDRPMPLEVAGDAGGLRQSVRIDIAPEQVELVDFTGAVN